MIPKVLSASNTSHVTNDKGGKQSAAEYDFTLINPSTLFEIATLLKRGSTKYGSTNHLLISQRDHINHALGHIYAHLANDTSDKHLVNAICRLMFALEVSEINNNG